MAHQILIVDDNADIQWILSDMLQAQGFLCETADDAMSALTMIQYRKFNLIVTDYQMPKMNGIEFIQKLSTMPDSSQIPVILITGSAGEDLSDSAHLAGASAVLTKPIKNEELITTIKRIMRSQSHNPDTCYCT